jgi:TrmH family RNA methyltransferase
VQRLRRLLGRRNERLREGRFVAEGVNLLQEALSAGAKIEAVFVGESWRRAGARLAGLVDQAHGTGARVFELERGVLERVAGTVSPQPVLAVVEVPVRALAEVGRGRPSLVVVCAGVRDPGNAGALARTAWAAGADAVVACEETVDFWSPKAVRSSAGAVFQVPLVAVPSVASALDAVGQWGLVRLGAVAEGGVDYSSLDLSRPVAFVLGNEAGGLPADQVAGRLDALVSVPMPGGAESLNVGVAAAVLCFEAVRQRRIGAHGRLGAGKLAAP